MANLYSPHVLYDNYVRGSLPESLALALLPLALFYLRWAAPGTDLRGQPRLADTNGMILAAQSFTLGGPYPASLWAAGHGLRDQVTVLLPVRLTSGPYTWSVSVA